MKNRSRFFLLFISAALCLNCLSGVVSGEMLSAGVENSPVVRCAVAQINSCLSAPLRLINDIMRQDAGESGVPARDNKEKRPAQRTEAVMSSSENLLKRSSRVADLDDGGRSLLPVLVHTAVAHLREVSAEAFFCCIAAFVFCSILLSYLVILMRGGLPFSAVNHIILKDPLAYISACGSFSFLEKK